MPKIIENARDRILDIAKIELLENGYNDFELRKIAKKCDMAVGTIYNYFPSKLILASTILLEDWLSVTERMTEVCKYTDDLYTGLREVFNELADFSFKYEEIIGNQIFIEEENSNPREKRNRHEAFVSVLTNIISELLETFNKNANEFEKSFIAEALLFYVVKRDFSYNKLENVFRKIVEK